MTDPFDEIRAISPEERAKWDAFAAQAREQAKTERAARYFVFFMLTVSALVMFGLMCLGFAEIWNRIFDGRNPRRVVLPDGLIHVVCVVIDGQLMDPIVCVDGLDAEARSNELVVHHHSTPGPKPTVQVATYKVRVVPTAREVSYADA